jgi:transcriptional regulator with XRE-family HTH domain
MGIRCVLRERRKALGLSQTELAVRAGIGVRTVERAESGSHRTSLLAMRALAEALGCPVEELTHDCDGSGAEAVLRPPNGGGKSDETPANGGEAA